MIQHRKIALHLIGLAGINAALFIPFMGRGFLFDDFGHLYVAAHEPLAFGLTRASGGWFYAPVAYLSFKIDWLLWGLQPFPLAATNLMIHTTNLFALYLLVLRLGRSPTGAWWAALGFALLFRANACAVMNIASRAHPMVALFWLLAMHASLSFARAQNWLTGAAVIAFATLAIFTKESGLTAFAAIGITLAYERHRGVYNLTPKAALGLSGALLAALLVYFFFRSRAGAAPVSFSGPTCCSYVPSLSLLAYNVVFYAWWTFGLLSLLAVAVILSLLLRGVRPRWDDIKRRQLWFVVMLFGAAIAPFVLMDWHSETYGYLPGVSAAILLGIVTGSLYHASPANQSRYPLLSSMPILLVVGLYVTLTVMFNNKWLRLAETNAAILEDIRTQQPTIAPHTFIALTYERPDPTNRFPDGFGDYSFPYALRVLYGDPTIDGRIVRTGEASGKRGDSPEIYFTYVGGNHPHAIKMTDAHAESK